ncbi:MAG: hypothetical protein ACHQ7M_10695, partial [Chloroflexota bacterium]
MATSGQGGRLTDRPARVVPRPADAPPDDASLDEVERWLRSRRTESAYGFNPATGKQVWERHTDGLEVALEPADRELLRGMIFTHNHPQGWRFSTSDPRRKGTSFSPHDIHSAALADMAECRAITPEYVFSMTRGTGGWPSPALVGPMYALEQAAYAREGTMQALGGNISPVQVIA